MQFDTILSTQDLLKYRFDLNLPEWGYNEYRHRHIPGAVFADLKKNLAGPILSTTGRHPLPDAEIFITQLGLWGITADTQVIAYDANSGVDLLRVHGGCCACMGI
jgi:thiosulfate/3-mercaptopyruvate sulfurtransferase